MTGDLSGVQLARVISAAAISNASWFAVVGLAKPLIFLVGQIIHLNLILHQT